jgi:hypothetical protein
MKTVFIKMHALNLTLSQRGPSTHSRRSTDIKYVPEPSTKKLTKTQSQKTTIASEKSDFSLGKKIFLN